MKVPFSGAFSQSFEILCPGTSSDLAQINSYSAFYRSGVLSIDGTGRLVLGLEGKAEDSWAEKWQSMQLVEGLKQYGFPDSRLRGEVACECYSRVCFNESLKGFEEGSAIIRFVFQLICLHCKEQIGRGGTRWYQDW